jgi:hypothetical protein
MGEITSNHRATRHPGRHQSEWPADFDRKWWPTQSECPADIIGIRSDIARTVPEGIELGMRHKPDLAPIYTTPC